MSKGYITEQELSEDLKKKINENPSSVKESQDDIKALLEKTMKDVLDKALVQHKNEYEPIYSNTKLNYKKTIITGRIDRLVYNENKLYTLVYDSASINVYNCNLEKIYNIPIKNMNGLAFLVDDYIYVGRTDETLIKIDKNTYKITNTKKFNKNIQSITCDDEYLYVVENGFKIYKLKKTDLTEINCGHIDTNFRKMICDDKYIYGYGGPNDGNYIYEVISKSDLSKKDRGKFDNIDLIKTDDSIYIKSDNELSKINKDTLDNDIYQRHVADVCSYKSDLYIHDTNHDIIKIDNKNNCEVFNLSKIKYVDNFIAFDNYIVIYTYYNLKSGSSNHELSLYERSYEITGYTKSK